MAQYRPSRFTVITNSAEAIPLRLMVEQFFEARAYGEESTLRDYRYDLNYLTNYIAARIDVRADRVMYGDLTEPAIEGFKRERLQVESVATVQRRLSAVKAFCRFVADRYNVANRATAISLPTVQIDEFKSLSDLQYASLQQVLPTVETRDRFVVELLMHTGLRNAGARGLLFRNVSDDWRFLNNVLEKGSKLRRVPISTELRKGFVRYMTWRKQFNAAPHMPLLVANPRQMGKKPHEYRMDAKTLWTICHRVLRTAGVPEELAHPHTLRHTFARQFLEQTSGKASPQKSLVMLQKILGHSDARTTMRYLTQDADEMFELMRDMV